MVRVPTVEDWSGREPGWRYVAPWVVRLTRLMLRPEVRGGEHLPRTGPALVVANHTSHLDTMLLLSLLVVAGRRPRFLALASLWDVPVVGRIFRWAHFIPVERGAPPSRTLTPAVAALAAGEVVVVYPEGRIVRPGAPPEPARRGVGWLILRSSAPVVPVAMLDVPAWRPARPPWRAPVRVRVGPPRRLDVAGDPEDPAAQQAASTAALAAVRSLEAGP